MSKKKLNLDFNFLDIDGQEYREVLGITEQGNEIKATYGIKASEWLGKRLFTSSNESDDFMKNYEMALELKSTGSVLLDTSDTDKLKAFVKGLKNAPAFVKAQIMLAFDSMSALKNADNT